MAIRADDLVFEPGEHIYHYRGVKTPGVTGVLEPWNGLQFVDPQILAAAAQFGTHVHDACDLFNRDELDEDDLAECSPLVWEHLQGWKLFLEYSGAVVVESELRVVSAKHGYAGTLDSICALQKTNRIYDIKTGAAVPKTVGPQVAAYNQAYREMTGRRLMKRYCVHLKANAYSVHPLQNPRDWDIFKAALTLHRWQTGE